MAIFAAHTAEHFATIEALARQIVPDFYAPFFDKATAEYLVESGHTAAALAAQVAKGYRHYLIDAGETSGEAGETSGEAGETSGEAGETSGEAGETLSEAGETSGEAGGRAVGYFALGSRKDDGVLLSHFYILREYRGRGLGQLAMEFIDRQVTAMGARRIELFVLRENTAAVGLYRKNGYVVAEEVLTRLGNGAVLEDYLMRKAVEN